MKKALSSLAVLVVLVSTLSVAAAEKSALTVPVNGVYAGGTFTGTFSITRFAAEGDQLIAHGYLSGTLTSATGVPVGSVMKSVQWPVDLAASGYGTAAKRAKVTSTATCEILSLVLGPLHLDLLGLVVDLNQVVLDIDAETGSGNLLGNLLCAVVSLLDGAGALVDIAHLLNQILDVLGGLLG